MAEGKKTWSFWTWWCAFWLGNFGLSNKTIWNRPRVASFRWFAVRPAFFSHFLLLLTSPFSVLLLSILCSPPVFPRLRPYVLRSCSSHQFLFHKPPLLHSAFLPSLLAAMQLRIKKRDDLPPQLTDHHKANMHRNTERQPQGTKVWTCLNKCSVAWVSCVQLIWGYQIVCWLCPSITFRQKNMLLHVETSDDGFEGGSLWKRTSCFWKVLKPWVVRLITFISNISKYSKDLILPLLPSSTTCCCHQNQNVTFRLSAMFYCE